MKSRQLLLAEIAQNPLPETSVLNELKKYSWDCDQELFIITKKHIRFVLTIFREKKLTNEQVEDWANRIECRDDIGYEYGDKGCVKEAIFWLANPDIYYPIDEKIEEKIEALFDEF